MKISIYQINCDRDTNDVLFVPYDRLPKYQGDSNIDSQIYDLVYKAEVDCKNLENVFQMFNTEKPSDFHGHSLSVSDIVEVIESDLLEPGFYFCDSVGFKKVEFDPDKTQTFDLNSYVGRIDYIHTNGTVRESFEYTGEYQFVKDIKEKSYYGEPIVIVVYAGKDGKTISQGFVEELDTLPKGYEVIPNPHLEAFSNDKTEEEVSKIKVIIVEPGKLARIAEIENTLEEKQRIVGGYVEQVMPFSDDIAIICNEEGKLHGLPLNRAIYEEDTKPATIIDIIAGTFLVVYAPIESEDYESLPDELAEKYLKIFEMPENFFRVGDEISAVKFQSEL